MVPIGSVMTLQEPDSGPYRVVRYNLYPAAEVQGDTKPGFSSGQSLDEMEKIWRRRRCRRASVTIGPSLPIQQKQARQHRRRLCSRAAIVFVFLLLAAQYESPDAAASR